MMRLVIILYFILATVWISHTRAWGATTLSRADKAWEELYQMFQIALPTSDIAVSLDVSLTMKRIYPDVRSRLLQALTQLPATDNIGVWSFGDRAYEICKEPVFQGIQAAETNLPLEATDDNTDIGTAVEAMLTWLERNKASDVQVLILVTDGEHEPPEGSSYPEGNYDASSWQELRHRAHKLASTKRLLVYGMGLRRRTDIALLRRIFPTKNVYLITGGAVQLSSMLEGLKDRLRLERLRDAVEKEIAEGNITIEPVPSKVHYQGKATFYQKEITVHFKSRYSRLPVIPHELILETPPRAEKLFSIAVPSQKVLEPEAEVPANLTIAIRLAKGRWKLGRSEEVFSGMVNFAPKFAFVHQNLLEQAGLTDTIIKARITPFGYEVRMRYGIPWAVLIVGLLTAIIDILCLRFARHKLDTSRLFGVLRSLSGEGKTIDLSTFTRSAPIGTGCAIDVSVPGVPQGKEVATLSTRERDNLLYLVLCSRSLEVRINGRPVTGEQELKIGDRLEIGQNVFLADSCSPKEARWWNRKLIAAAVVATVSALIFGWLAVF